jgi:hypothetical protein
MISIMDGFIYILKSVYCDDLLHIGYTQRNPSDRAEESSTTIGSSGNFMLEYQLKIPKSDKVIKLINTKLNQYRDKIEKEVFNIPLDFAKHMVKKIAVYVIKENIIQLENEIEKEKKYLYMNKQDKSKNCETVNYLV